MMRNYIGKGKLGEYYASILLQNSGYKIISRNFRSRFGEIDILAKKDKTLYFCEVKTRWNIKYGFPEESVNAKKLDKIKKTIYYYLLQKQIQNIPYKILIIAQIVSGSRLYYQKLINLS